MTIDDGSDKETKDNIKKISSKDANVSSVRLDENQGKGVVVERALRLANSRSYTHAFQIDAHGQHSLENIQTFINLSIEQPAALISGCPIYDNSIPWARKFGRWITHFWVWIETLSFVIKDSMCGYRIYPVQKTFDIMDNVTIGKRMDFDTDIIVRLYWNGIPIIMEPVMVTYPEVIYPIFML